MYNNNNFVNFKIVNKSAKSNTFSIIKYIKKEDFVETLKKFPDDY